jgi:hypothetical protein
MSATEQLVLTLPGLNRNRRAVTFVRRTMRFSGLCRLWLVVATLSLLSAPTFASGALTFVCDGDLVARPDCCCPGGPHHGAPSAGERASVGPACCCRVSRTEGSDATVATAPRVAAQVSVKVLLAPATTLALGAVVQTGQTQPAVGLAHPPPLAVPILLAKQSFLIWATAVSFARRTEARVVGYKTGSVQRAEADAERYSILANQLAAPTAATPVRSSEAEHYAELAQQYRAMGGVAYKSGLVQWAEAQERKYEAGTVTAMPTTYVPGPACAAASKPVVRTLACAR